MKEFEDKLLLLGRKLRAYAKWDCNAGYYASSQESAIAYAKAEIAEEIANMLDQVFDIDSGIDSMSAKEFYGRQTKS